MTVWAQIAVRPWPSAAAGGVERSLWGWLLRNRDASRHRFWKGAVAAYLGSSIQPSQSFHSCD
jgi:hypothetical protein